MEKRSLSIVFFCKRTRVNKKGKAPIYVRITTSGVNTEFHIQCQTEPEKWSQKTEKVIGRDSVSLQINEIITSYRSKILSVYNQLICEGVDPLFPK